MNAELKNYRENGVKIEDVWKRPLFRERLERLGPGYVEEAAREEQALYVGGIQDPGSDGC
jgi:hypothetical protein